MHWWGKHQSAACPWCGTDLETMAHIMQCLNQEVQAISNQNILELRALLKDLEMDPAIREDLSKGVNAWRQNKQPPPMLTEPGHLQSFISWDNFCHGFMAITWEMHQANYYMNQQL